jgi:hypothetical protein
MPAGGGGDLIAVGGGRRWGKGVGGHCVQILCPHECEQKTLHLQAWQVSLESRSQSSRRGGLHLHSKVSYMTRHTSFKAGKSTFILPNSNQYHAIV